MAHLMDPLQGMMKVLGTPNITPQLKQTVIDGVTREAGGRSVEQLARDENRVMIGLLKLRAKAATASSATKRDRTTETAGANA